MPTGRGSSRELALAALVAALAGATIGLAGAGMAAAVLVLAAALLVTCVRPGWPIYAAVAVAPLHVYRIPIGVGNLSPFRALILIAAVGLVVQWAFGRTNRRLDLADRKLFVTWLGAIAAFLLYEGLVALPRSGSQLGSTLFQVHVFFFFAVSLIVLGIASGVVSRCKLIIVALASAVPQLLLLAQQRITAGSGSAQLPFSFLIPSDVSQDIRRAGVQFGENYRPAATFSDPNFFAIFAAATFILADEAARKVQHPWGRAALTALRVALVAGVLTSLSRSGVVIIGVYLLVTRVRGGRLSGVGRSIGVAIVCAVVAFVALKPYLSYSTLEQRVNDPVSNSVHQETRRVALEQGSASPLTGIGLANLGQVLQQPPDRSSAHSQPFTLFAEEGAIGLLLAALALGFGVAVWTYDFFFVLDVATIWLALLATSLIGTHPRRALAAAEPVRSRARLVRAPGLTS
jgi:hypothetical protein